MIICLSRTKPLSFRSVKLREVNACSLVFKQIGANTLSKEKVKHSLETLKISEKLLGVVLLFRMNPVALNPKDKGPHVSLSMAFLGLEII